MARGDVPLFLDYATIARQPGPFSPALLEANLLNPTPVRSPYVSIVQGLQSADFGLEAVLVNNTGVKERGAVGAAALALENVGFSDVLAEVPVLHETNEASYVVKRAIDNGELRHGVGHAALVTNRPYDIGTEIIHAVAGHVRQPGSPRIRVTLAVPVEPEALRQQIRLRSNNGLSRSRSDTTQIKATRWLQLNTVALHVQDDSYAGERLAEQLRRLHSSQQ